MMSLTTTMSAFAFDIGSQLCKKGASLVAGRGDLLVMVIMDVGYMLL